jgi:hypothetical protein
LKYVMAGLVCSQYFYAMHGLSPPPNRQSRNLSARFANHRPPSASNGDCESCAGVCAMPKNTPASPANQRRSHLPSPLPKKRNGPGGIWGRSLEVPGGRSPARFLMWLRNPTSTIKFWFRMACFEMAEAASFDLRISTEFCNVSCFDHGRPIHRPTVIPTNRGRQCPHRPHAQPICETRLKNAAGTPARSRTLKLRQNC